jgi:hypothetical protein
MAAVCVWVCTCVRESLLHRGCSEDGCDAEDDVFVVILYWCRVR